MSVSAQRLFGRTRTAIFLMTAMLSLALMHLATGPRPVGAQPAGPDQSGAALVGALQRGGYVILFRHGITDQAQKDVQPLDFTACRAQRNLNDTGRAQASAIGDAIQAIAIPIGQVLSSGYCRARDTAELIYGPAQPVDDLLEIVTPLDNAGNPRPPTPAATAQQRTAALQLLLATTPAAGTNTILVSHGSNIEAATTLKFEEGDAAVFLPGGDAGFTLVARLNAADWTALPQAQTVAAGTK